MDKAYSRENAAHLANYDGGSARTSNTQKRRRVDYRRRAIRNNDNYAFFTLDIGRFAYSGTSTKGLPALTEFPAPGFEW